MITPRCLAPAFFPDGQKINAVIGQPQSAEAAVSLLLLMLLIGREMTACDARARDRERERKRKRNRERSRWRAACFSLACVFCPHVCITRNKPRSVDCPVYMCVCRLRVETCPSCDLMYAYSTSARSPTTIFTQQQQTSTAHDALCMPSFLLKNNTAARRRPAWSAHRGDVGRGALLRAYHLAHHPRGRPPVFVLLPLRPQDGVGQRRSQGQS